MKKKYPSVPGSAFIPIVLFFGVLFYGYMIVECIHSNQLVIMCGFALFLIFNIILGIYTIPQTLCTIEITNEHIIAVIPFYRKIVLEYDKCTVGFDYHVQNGKKRWWIYLCYGNKPPYKGKSQSNRINSLRCRQGFVRILYREDVYNALLEVLPKRQYTALKSSHRCAGLEK